ncbi:MAG: prepilin-type N-terminal cleavage/methylation domain-containing protein [Chthoniobacterales bacterium]|nr:prepilin-type N-terminal cleavage/methylation domain-containing protein [Chthoniobacterales bacterium]
MRSQGRRNNACLIRFGFLSGKGPSSRTGLLFMRPCARQDRRRRNHAFSLSELLVAIAILALLAALAAAVFGTMMHRGDRADALAKTRAMGAAVLHYASDHGGLLPPLFPGQVLEYEHGRGGRIVTECAAYLGIRTNEGKFIVESLLPRAYVRVAQPSDRSQMRVWVMNSSVTNGSGAVISPFGRVATAGQPPVENMPLAAVVGPAALWMMSTADRKQPQVAAAPWKANAPPDPPLGDRRAVFRFDGTAELVHTNTP